MLTDDGPDHRGDDLCRFPWMAVIAGPPLCSVVLTRTSAAALLAIARAYGADEATKGSRLGSELDAAVEPLRDVLTVQEALDGDDWLGEVWGEEAVAT